MRIDIRYPEDGSILDIGALDVAPGSHTVVYGPNGAGKTTLLRRLAGIGGTDPMLDAVYQPQQPYMFRGRAGWNLGLGLSPEEAGRAGQFADRLGIRHLLAGLSENLSGGERQRLALARTLAKEGEWVLLDEPLSAIDRADHSTVLAAIASGLEGRSAIVVTHDLDVTVALADRLAVLDRGRILQQGPVAEVMGAPESIEVARIIGVGNVITGRGHAEGGLTRVESEALTVIGRGSVEGPARAMFPAEAVVLGGGGSTPTSPRNHWVGRVGAIRERATVIEVVVDVGRPVVALVTPGAAAELGIEVGGEVVLSVKATSVMVVPR